MNGFLLWKLADPRFQAPLLEITRVLLDIYSAPLIAAGGAPFIERLSEWAREEAELGKELKQVGGQIEMLFRAFR